MSKYFFIAKASPNGSDSCIFIDRWKKREKLKRIREEVLKLNMSKKENNHKRKELDVYHEPRKKELAYLLVTNLARVTCMSELKS